MCLLVRTQNEVGRALEWSFFALLNILVHLICHAVGIEMSELEGCWCHSEVLAEGASYKKRRAKMIELTGSPICPWKGKQIVPMSMGKSKIITSRVRNSTSAMYAQALAEAPQELAVRALEIEEYVKSYWCSVWEEKTEYYQHMPFSACRAFAAYMGYSLQEAKDGVRKSFEEFDSVDDKGKVDDVSKLFFERTSSVSQQLWDFGNSPTTELHMYPQAFHEVQEASFGSSIERYTEREHIKTKLSTTRGLRYAKPALTCARQRREQIEDMLGNEEGYDFVIQNWQSRSLYTILLAHLLNVHDVKRLSVASRQSRLYGYAVEDHFPDNAEERRAALALVDARNKVQSVPLLDVSASSRAAIDFLKSRMETGYILSVPAALMGCVEGSAVLDPRNMVAATMADSILVDPAEVIGGWENAVFFEVLDPRPENKSTARILHMERWRTKMSVRRQRVDIRGDAVWLTAGAEEGEMVNLMGWCNEENFAAIMKGLCFWRRTPAGLTMHLLPPPSSLGLSMLPPERPDISLLVSYVI